jgi:3-carboxy-cis,cis-muconate cycloisomerase
MELLDLLFGSAAINELFTDRSRLQRMLDFEAALARAEASVGVIPSSTVRPITEQCRAELFDLAALGEATVKTGNHAIPIVKQLTELVGQHDEEAQRYVHWGATSQDVVDTGLMLQLRDALSAIQNDLNRLCERLTSLAVQYRSTPVVARTLLQQAVPTVFGLKVAGWLDALARHRARIQDLQARAIVLQFGGAAGTLAMLGNRGLDVAAALAEGLQLVLPALPWHSHRDRVVEVATTLGLLTGTLGKMARDISLQMQTEVGEVFEPSGEGRGGSSTMPHKRNPITCEVVLAAAQRVPGLVGTMLAAMPQEHERSLGGWHAEWETLPEIVRASAGALHHMVEMVAGLEVDPTGMQQNLELTHGLIFAEAVTAVLGKKVGKSKAHQILESASRKAIAEKKHLREVLAADAQVMPHLNREEIASLFEPLNYIGVAGKFIDRAIEASKSQFKARD